MPRTTKPKTPPAPVFEAKYEGPEPALLFDYLKTTAQFSGRSLHKYFFKGLILVNGRRAHSTAMLKPGDKVKALRMHEPAVLAPEEMPLTIVFENDDFLILNKPAQIAVHPVKEITGGTLANGVAAYFQKIGLKARVRPVNRLDYGTSGLIIFAKKAQAQAKASIEIQNHLIRRIYYALVQGVPSPREGAINLPIRESKGNYIVSEGGQPAETHYRVLEEFGAASLLELSLKTGRTHQIRAHLRAIGCPITGDLQYGAQVPGPLQEPSINHPALHAGKLDFTGSSFDIPALTAPLPPDFQGLLDFYRKQGQ
ncbi:MAG: RluA family pseudouridine synthase [Firmicutes bacterium]|nr:RluA family pseudouridine synthase [Bacillota bacterium]